MLSWRQRNSKSGSLLPVNIAVARFDHPAEESLDPRSPNFIPPHFVVKEYLQDTSPVFRHLNELRKMGWENPEGDLYYKKQRSDADNASPEEQKRFFSMMRSVGKEIDAATDAFSCPHPRMLDLCMAPGGYTASVLDRHTDANVRGISLPCSLGGHILRVSHGPRDPRVQVQFMDLTMLASEFGVSLDDIPPRHPEASHFNSARPYYGEEFDIVICDGQVLRSHRREEWREPREATRLATSQLILGLKRIKTGGTFVMLLHKLEAWNTCKLLKSFDAFSSLFLYKPESKWAQRSSFYLIAKNVQPQSEPAKEAVEGWKKDWYTTTFGGDGRAGSDIEDPSTDDVAAFLAEFGHRLVELGQTVWDTQARALERAPYVKLSPFGRIAGLGGTG